MSFSLAVKETYFVLFNVLNKVDIKKKILFLFESFCALMLLPALNNQ